MYVAPYSRTAQTGRYAVAYRRGMGDVTKTQLAKTSGAVVGSSILALSPLAGPAAPFVALAGLAVTGLSNLFASVFSGCGQTCVEASQLVDKVAAYWQENMAQYFALPVRTQAAQQAALQVFDYGWSMVLQGCGDPALGDAGKRCISERQRGGKYDSFAANRDPIANDPNVVPDAPVAAAGDSILSAVGIAPNAQVGGVDVNKLILPGLLIGMALLL